MNAPRLFRHSPKALRTRAEDCPRDRIFLVTEEFTGEYERAGKKCLLAWKCTLEAGGLDHPAFTTPLSLTPEGISRGALARGENRSTPTAEFVENDCLYEEITLTDLRNIPVVSNQRMEKKIERDTAIRGITQAKKHAGVTVCLETKHALNGTPEYIVILQCDRDKIVLAMSNDIRSARHLISLIVNSTYNATQVY